MWLMCNRHGQRRSSRTGQCVCAGLCGGAEFEGEGAGRGAAGDAGEAGDGEAG